ncbi:MAG: polysaccharide biosynthesis C-terminal domain-containing protein, partial [Clostridia bacterium]|nr:polysaccharide biosynthesis C-terminal domain-containing protein [Clostridia bacterium]
ALIWTDCPDEVFAGAHTYLWIYLLGIPFSMFFNFGAAILRASGDTKTPLYYMTISGIINVCLNLFFVIVLRWNIAGVAIATIISQFISSILVL